MKRKLRGVWPKGATLEQIEQHIAEEGAKPINRAYSKLYSFVNDCVVDPDFKQSPALLHLLIILRDELADGATEEWSLDDYLEPIIQQLSKAANRARQENLKRIKKEIIKEWLSEPRGHGDRERFADAMAERYKEGKKYPVRATQIRKEYLSKKSIQEYQGSLPDNN